MSEWVQTNSRLPKEGEIVETKLDDGTYIRNVQPLKRKGNLWFLPDDAMYVYYTPTHWRPV